MGVNRVPARVTFAIEATRACLEQIPAPQDWSRNWRHFDWSRLSENSLFSRVIVRPTVRNSSVKIFAQCDVSQDEDKELRATCVIVTDHRNSTFWVSFDSDGNLVAILDKRYGPTDVDWLEEEAARIKAHVLYPWFRAHCPQAAEVLETGGATYGRSLDAAIEEFKRFENLHATS